MKQPKYFVETMQQALDIGINAFAFQLMAESIGDDPNKFGDENLILQSRTHHGVPIYFIVTKTPPRKEDFTE